MAERKKKTSEALWPQVGNCTLIKGKQVIKFLVWTIIDVKKNAKICSHWLFYLTLIAHNNKWSHFSSCKRQIQILWLLKWVNSLPCYRFTLNQRHSLPFKMAQKDHRVTKLFVKDRPKCFCPRIYLAWTEVQCLLFFFWYNIYAEIHNTFTDFGDMHTPN